MKTLFAILACLMVGACASKDGSNVTVAGDCVRTEYTNGSRVVCPNFDALQTTALYQVVGVEDLCGNGSRYTLLRLDDGHVANLSTGSIELLTPGTYVTADSCHYNVGSAPAFIITY